VGARGITVVASVSQARQKAAAQRELWEKFSAMSFWDMHSELPLGVCFHKILTANVFFFLRKVLAWRFKGLMPLFISNMSCWAARSWCSSWEDSALLFERALGRLGAVLLWAVRCSCRSLKPHLL